MRNIAKPSSPKKEFNLFENNDDIKLDDIKLDKVDLPDLPSSSGDVKSVSMSQFDNDPLLSTENTESTDGFKPIHTLSAGENDLGGLKAVSYTHLTLPTKRIV